MFFRKQKSEYDFLLSKGYSAIRETLPEDLFIIGFPKSGNTWMQHMLTGVLYGADMSRIQNNLVRELTPDEQQIEYYKRYNEVMAFKSHHLPSSRYKKVIYLVRDGRDAYTSFYHMESGRGKNVSLEDVVRRNLGLAVSWQEHVSQWVKNSYNANILFVRYEDLINDSLGEMQKIVDHFGLSIEDGLLSRIVENCSFEGMRRKEESSLWEKSKEWKEGKYFVRKGSIGDYANLFTEELNNYFLELAASEMRRFGYL